MKARVAEVVAVLAIMVGVNIVAHQPATEALAMMAVLLALAHTQVTHALEERRAKRMPPSAFAQEWLLRLPIAIQLAWCSYCLVHHSYSALAGCFLLLLYPGWRYTLRKHLQRRSTGG